MATKYNLTTAFTAITETSGTIQNVGNESVELASSTNAVAGEGIVLNPSEKRSFKGALSARSIGDAGADVNVVDFTEAGEGGEEYVLPIASDTELGGIKISNSFTVANDGTLNLKKSGKTILGGVKSSDDEGKVIVNNDGTMTYNPLGYRQPSTTYAAGDIKYHSALPTGWYLECTTEGTSGSGDLTISSPTIGGTVTDGTVVWTVSSNLSLLGGVLYGSTIKRNDSNSALVLRGGNSSETGGYISLRGSNNSSGPGTVVIQATTGGVDFSNIVLSPDGRLQLKGYDLGGSAIVAKSLSANGYIKYASGLIMQWGKVGNPTNNTVGADIIVDFPISFNSTNYNMYTSKWGGGNYWLDVCPLDAGRTVSSRKVRIVSTGTSASNDIHYFGWLAIGN